MEVFGGGGGGDGGGGLRKGWVLGRCRALDVHGNVYCMCVCVPCGVVWCGVVWISFAHTKYN